MWNFYRYGGACGYITDTPGAGLVQMGARFDWPEVGRFVQQDPAWKGINWYAYVGDNPLTGIDPEGLGKFCIGAYIGLGGEFCAGTNPDGGWFIGVHPGVGGGLGASYDPCGTSPGWSPENRPGLGGYLGVSASAGAHWGPAGGAVGAEAGGYFSPKGPGSPNGVKGYADANVSPLFGIGASQKGPRMAIDKGGGIGANAGVNVGLVGQPWPF